ncbi:MAG: hypothetical protein KBA38_08930 [Negativicutes bacterium]|nr:hypothetical protein [Negativicutes bacterium]
MARVMVREREKNDQREWLFLGVGAGFGVGYLIALMQHQAALTKMLNSL